MTEASSNPARDKSSSMTQDMASELAYVRSLAEEGRNAPLVGGRFYVIWGGVMGLAAFIVYLNSLDVIALGAMGGYIPWLIGGGAGWALSLTLGRQAGAKPGAHTRGNQTAFSVWFGVGIFMTVLWFTLMVVHNNFTGFGVPPFFLFSMMFPVAFGLYGVAFFATATAAGLSWLKWVSVLSWMFSIGCLFLLGSPHQLLLGVAGSFFCAVLPGLILMRAEPRDII